MFIRALLAVALAFSVSAGAQDYPNRPIRVIVPYPPGGGPSLVARLIGEKIKDKWGQPVVVENRPGAGGNIGAEAVAKAPPDGHTLLLAAPGPLVINKSVYANLAYDQDAWVPISMLVWSPTLLIVNPKVAAKTLQELIAYAKANPDKLNYGSPGSGSTGHLTTELFKSMAGIRMLHVPYKGLTPARTDLLAGQIDLMFTEVGGAIPLITSGKVRALAIGSTKRDRLLPDIPTMSEVLPGFVSVPWFGIVGPPGMPSAIASQLSGVIAAALKQPDVVKRLQSLSLDPVGTTPEEAGGFMKKEAELWGKVARQSGAKAN